MISVAVAESRLPVGSSASSILGRSRSPGPSPRADVPHRRARGSTLERSPQPDRRHSPGAPLRDVRRPAGPPESSAARRSRLPSAPSPGCTPGISSLPSIPDTRPVVRRHIGRGRDHPPRTHPDVARSRPPIRFKSVDFPDPDFPSSATRSPGRTSSETPRSAKTAEDAVPNASPHLQPERQGPAAR